MLPLTVNISAETASAKPNAFIFVAPSRKMWSTPSPASTSLPHSQFHLNLSDGNSIAPRSLAAKGVQEMYSLALKPLQYKKTEKNHGFLCSSRSPCATRQWLRFLPHRLVLGPSWPFLTNTGCFRQSLTRRLTSR